MKRNDGDLYLFKIIGIGLVLFFLIMNFWATFGGAFVDSNSNEKQERISQAVKDEAYLRTDLRDSVILGKFYNSKGHFVVVYDENDKAPKIFPVDEKEWGTMRVGELY